MYGYGGTVALTLPAAAAAPRSCSFRSTAARTQRTSSVLPTPAAPCTRIPAAAAPCPPGPLVRCRRRPTGRSADDDERCE